VSGCATTNGEPLYEEAYNHAQLDVGQERGVSYRDGEFLKASAGGTSSLGAVELDSFTQGNAKRLQEFFARGLLTVDTGNLLDPTNPPISVVLHDCSKRLSHKASFDVYKHLRAG